MENDISTGDNHAIYPALNLRRAGISLLGLAIATKVKQEHCPVQQDHLIEGSAGSPGHPIHGGVFCSC